MKKLMVLLCAVVFIFAAMDLAQGHSDWAQYKENPVPADVNIAKGHRNPDGTIRCCDCHGVVPNIPPIHCQ